ncbi:hypothetical protein OpiT1DRAFT_05961 [Opitutaceae bacterium TAV1]|nr:hypothetical protein OpiT1DRAFT_05961 [Opitutaceae bacterium TAV1]
MSRKTVHRSLPDFPTALGKFSGFPKGKSHLHIITGKLRTLARRLRRTKPTPFYPMREVADFFQTPLGTISAVYQTLEREGLLNRLRGSQTMLMGKTTVPKDAVRGVVGIPIWLHSIMVLPYTRTFTMVIEEQLREKGYVADFIFHRTKTEENDPEFALRLLRHRLDVVVWHSPSAGAKQNILSLRERGVRVLITERAEIENKFPVILYPQDYQPAYREMARCWRKSGIRKIWLWSSPAHLRGQFEIDIFRSLMSEHGMPVEITGAEPEQLLAGIRGEKRKSDVGVVFLDTTNSEQICNREPQVIEEMAGLARIGFCMGTMRSPYLCARGVRADVVMLSPDEIASQFANDISRLAMIPDGVRHVFEARYYENRPIGGDLLDGSFYASAESPASGAIRAGTQ